MVYRIFFLFCVFFLNVLFIAAQEVYFDKIGKAVDSASSYVFFELVEAPDSYRAYFSSNHQVYFEGRILRLSDSSESENIYTGSCVWFHKNGNLQRRQSFDDNGLLSGISQWFDEGGSVLKEVEYIQGRVKDMTWFEFDEDGIKTRAFHDSFEELGSDWDIYTSSVSETDIQNGRLKMSSFDPKGTSRYIYHPIETGEYTIEAKVEIGNMARRKQSAGLIFSFKDWDNYWYFTIGPEWYSIGYVIEGIHETLALNHHTTDVDDRSENLLKILHSKGRFYFSINGELQLTSASPRARGNYIGFIVSGNTTGVEFDDLIIKEMNIGAADAASLNPDDDRISNTGTGFIIANPGYVVTNHHVIDGRYVIYVELSSEEATRTYRAELVHSDEVNDLALLKIIPDSSSLQFDIPYQLRASGGLDLGSSAYTIGFPLALSGMGRDPKFTDGKISSRTGYENAVNSFQTTIPVQPGNSGGPVLNSKGELIGVINASIPKAENVSYAIKISYLLPLLDMIDPNPVFTENNELQDMSLEEQIKLLLPLIVLVKCI